MQMDEESLRLLTYLQDGHDHEDRVERCLQTIALDIRLLRKGGMVKAKKRSGPPPVDWSPLERKDATAVLSYLNKRAGRSFKPVDSNLKLIIRLMRDGHDADDFKSAIDGTVERWRGDPKMEQFLRPATLFGPDNFATKYAGQSTEED